MSQGPVWEPGHELERPLLGNLIDGNPEADVLAPVNVVEGLILVPRSALRSAGLFHQHVIVEEAHLARLHQARRGGSERCLLDETAICGVVLPVAEVLHEPTGIIGPAGDDRAWARRDDVGVDAFAQ